MLDGYISQYNAVPHSTEDRSRRERNMLVHSFAEREHTFSNAADQ